MSKLQHFWAPDDEIDLETLGILDQKGKIINPFEQRTREELENPAIHLLKMMMNPEYFYFTCKYLLNVKILPFQCVILRELWYTPFPMLIGSRGLGKSFVLGLYAVLRALFLQGRKIVITGAGFRQSKIIMQYAENIWYNSPVLQSLVKENSRSGPHHDADKWELRLGDSTVTALPIGDGSKIRGYRANDILADEFASIPNELFETVISGFGVVNLDPVEKVWSARRKKVLRNRGVLTKEMEADLPQEIGNQTVISGTGFWQFNHFATYWKKWKGIIESKGDPETIAKLHGGEPQPDLNWRDYSVIRIPVELLPDEFMDLKHIARSRATVHRGIFINEFGACLAPDTYLLTDQGVKPISEVVEGDMVLTHKGRFRPVLEVMKRPYSGDIINYRSLGCGIDQRVTPEHPYWAPGDTWTPLSDVDTTVHLANLRKLSGLGSIDIRDIATNYFEEGGLVYPRPGNSKVTQVQRDRIRSLSHLNCAEISRKLDIKYSTVHQTINKSRPRYNAVPPVISLDYNFGLIVGYYAAEGSVIANGRAASFALDGHVSASLESYVVELSAAIEAVFGITAKHYDRDDVIEVNINQRLAAETLAYVCPGKAASKRVRPDVLFSNPEFLRGFVVGYWNGDGHIPIDRVYVSANSTSLSLLAQVRMALSYFKISATVAPIKNTVSVIHGKEYQCQQAYSLTLSGDNAARFLGEFYGREVASSGSKMPNCDHCANLPVVRKDIEHYSGFVYNLEVAEDHSYSLLNATVHNCFSADSNGFYKRSLIETCVTTKPVQPVGSNFTHTFTAALRGNPNMRYVYGVDTASESDRFAIIVIEVHEDHRRIVYCWTATRKEHIARLEAGIPGTDHDFYSFCARKIRELMRVFPCDHIAMDSQGGGRGVSEALHDPDKIEEGELPIWEITEFHPLAKGKAKASDDYPGLHMLEMVNFADAEYTSVANHGMKKDFEDRVLLFPAFDAISIEEARMSDAISNRMFDTLEDCVAEIEQLKEELATIVYSQTGGTGRDKWDTPEVKIEGSKKGRLRKDRYSALVMANAAARTLSRRIEVPMYIPNGGFVGNIKKDESKVMYNSGPEWFMKQANQNVAVFSRMIRG